MCRLSIIFGSTVEILTFEGQKLTFPTRFEARILGALALAVPHELSRAKLAHCLWPDSTSHLANQNFRQKLSKLKSLIPEIQSDRQAIWIPPNLVHWTDLSPVPELSRMDCEWIAETCLLSGHHTFEVFKSLRGESSTNIFSIEFHPQVSSKRVSTELLESTLSISLSGSFCKSNQLAKLYEKSQFRLTSGQFDQVFRAAQNLEVQNWSERDDRILLAKTLQNLAAQAHRLGKWHQSILLEREVVQQVKDIDPEWRNFAQFRVLRKQLDLRLDWQTISELVQLRNQVQSQLKAWIEMNLVFAFSVKRDWSQAAESLSRSHEFSGENASYDSWLFINESLLHCAFGRPHRAIECLREARDVAQSSVTPRECFWHWYAAIHALQFTSRSTETAILHTIAERERQLQGSFLTPINQFLVDRSVQKAQNLSSFRQWSEATTSALQNTETEADLVYREILSSGI